MIEREILGYSIFFKDAAEAEKFFKKVPKSFEPSLNKEEREVMLLGVNKLSKEDFTYVFKKEGEKIAVEPLKIMFVETLFARE
jgi:hypothetical protein